MEITVREFRSEDTKDAIAIWNEVVDQGKAFPQLEDLGVEDGEAFFKEQSYTGIAVNENDEIIGYAMFSRFHIEGKYENELLILTPVAVKTRLQRQHISKDILEYGFDVAKRLGFKAILVEGNPRNYNNRGFQPSYKFGIEAGPNIRLPHPDCLMIKELDKGVLDKMSGLVDYSFYETLHEG